MPVRRSAFTYCEDDIPSGLNLAKHKYGGPFSTEQVEDVKAFYGISKVLFALGLVLFLTFATDGTLYQFTKHGTEFDVVDGKTANRELYNQQPVKMLLINSGLLTHLVSVLAIPLHLFLIRPFFYSHIPGMLKRMALGAVMSVLALTCTLAVGVWAHARHSNVGCMFDSTSTRVILNITGAGDLLNTSSNTGPFYDTSIIAIPRILQSLSDMLICIALYEFICSQSPHSMKGLLIGLSFTVKGLFQFLAAAVTLQFALSYSSTHISCGVSYYVMNIGVGVVAMFIFSLVARRYRNRERDELANIHMYAEEYYSKGPPENKLNKKLV